MLIIKLVGCYSTKEEGKEMTIHDEDDDESAEEATMKEESKGRS